MAANKTIKWILSLAIVFIAILPLVLYWWVLGRVPSINSEGAIQWLNMPGSNFTLVDVRDEEVYDQQHVSESVNWPLEDILQVTSPNQIPSSFTDKTLLLLCDGGLDSAIGVRKLKDSGIEGVYNILGGYQEWVKAAARMQDLQFSQFDGPGTPTYLTAKQMPLLDQAAAVLSIAVIKPAYTLLTLGLIWYLKRQQSTDLVTLWWGLLFFFIGEAFCGINVIFFDHSSWLSEYFHSYGMVLAFGFTIYAIMEGLDYRLIRLSAPQKRCAAIGICGSCYKNDPVDCGSKRLLTVLVPIFMVVALIPLFVEFSLSSYSSNIFGFLFHHGHPMVFQIYERRFLPIMALICFGAAFLVLYFDKNRGLSLLARILVAAGFGSLGFSMFRLVFVTLFEENLVWFSFWEESTELLFILAVIGVLWLFRKSLIPDDGTPT